MSAQCIAAERTSFSLMTPSGNRIEEIALQIFARLRHDTAPKYGSQPWRRPHAGAQPLAQCRRRCDADIAVMQSMRGLLPPARVALARCAATASPTEQVRPSHGSAGDCFGARRSADGCLRRVARSDCGGARCRQKDRAASRHLGYQRDVRPSATCASDAVDGTRCTAAKRQSLAVQTVDLGEGKAIACGDKQF